MKKLISLLLTAALIVVPLAVSAQDNGDVEEKPDAQDPCIEAQLDVERETQEILWLAAGCLFGCLGVGAAYLIEPSPSAMNLVGKSPEYVAAYTDCYKDKGRSIQTNKALIGCIAGTLLWGAVSIAGSLLFGGIIIY